MKPDTLKRWGTVGLLAATASWLAGCGGSDSAPPAAAVTPPPATPTVVVNTLPQMTAATPATLANCSNLTSAFSFANTTIASAVSVPAGSATWSGTPIASHCLVRGEMFRRTSTFDGVSYAIKFEMRMPQNWNGRFYYQGNGGADGVVRDAFGLSDPVKSPALIQGFAVISSDAGHEGQTNTTFGIDNQARLDYGYQAVAKLTPMAKSLIKTAYGKGPDRSYIGGCSNAGRHTMVAMTRMPGEYDGYVIGAPGYRLPLAAIASQFGAQRYASVATNPADISTGFTAAERAMVSSKVLAKCDALDGATDGMIQDVNACQAAFNFQTDVPTCTGARDGTCLSAAQKTAIAPIFSGAVDGRGNKFYASFPFDTGHNAADSSFWEFTAPLFLDSPATAFVWSTPPASTTTFNPIDFALNTSVDSKLAAVSASNLSYTESGLSFMMPVEPTKLGTLKNRGAKVLAYHGVSDPIFSVNDTANWYDGLKANNNGDASDFARFYRVPGMSHCGAGPSTDGFDMLAPLVQWVEQGKAPDSIIANARGAGNAAGVNPDVPASWSPSRTRPLCPYPQVARLKTGATNLESADSFQCQ